VRTHTRSICSTGQLYYPNLFWYHVRVCTLSLAALWSLSLAHWVGKGWCHKNEWVILFILFYFIFGVPFSGTPYACYRCSNVALVADSITMNTNSFIFRNSDDEEKNTPSLKSLFFNPEDAPHHHLSHPSAFEAELLHVLISLRCRLPHSKLPSIPRSYF